MSAFAREGDRVRYYEINSDGINQEGDRPTFTCIKQSQAESTIVAADALLAVKRELATVGRRSSICWMDAFASDSVPLHLVTVEAFRLTHRTCEMTVPSLQ